MKYDDFGLAPNPRRVNLFINKKGLKIATVEIKPRAGEPFAEAFLKINPQATVPCLELDLKRAGKPLPGRSAGHHDARLRPVR